MHHSSLFWFVSITLLTPVMLLAKSNPEIPLGLKVAVQEARHQIEVIKEKDKPTHWWAHNASNRLNMAFDGRGVTAFSSLDDWYLRMELIRLGSPELPKPVKQPKVTIKGSRLTYDRGPIQEWYINDPKGLEQGFTLYKPLSKEDLVLQLALEGNVKPTLIEKGQVLQFTTPQGKMFRYKGLKAWDANGEHLPATMALEDNCLQLQVKVADAAYPITIDPLLALVESQTLPGPPAEEVSSRGGGSGAGITVALSNDTALVGVPFWYGDGPPPQTATPGAAFIFTRGEGGWTEQARLSPSEGRVYFGSSVALSGTTAVVMDHSPPESSSRVSSINVFTRKENTWSLQAQLTPSDIEGYNFSGVETVATSGDTLVTGTLRVFNRTGDTWAEQPMLIPSDVVSGSGTEGQFVISSVAISDDTIVMTKKSQGDSQEYSVYVFTLAGDTWVEEAKLTTSDLPEDAKPGGSADVSGDMIIWSGAVHDHGVADGSGHRATFSGSSYIFTRNEQGWSYQNKLTPSEPAEYNDRITQPSGANVALDNNVALLQLTTKMAPNTADGGPEVGATYVFTHNEDATWSEQAKLVSSGGADPGELALSGNTALLGKIYANGDSAYVFDLSNTESTPAVEEDEGELPEQDSSGGGTFDYILILLLGFMGATGREGPVNNSV